MPAKKQPTLDELLAQQAALDVQIKEARAAQKAKLRADAAKRQAIIGGRILDLCQRDAAVRAAVQGIIDGLTKASDKEPFENWSLPPASDLAGAA